MKVGIIGATGYGGVELIRLLQHHPQVEIASIISGSQGGEMIENIYPHLQGVLEQKLDGMEAERIQQEVDLVFFATPSGVSTEYLPQFLDAGVSCIDVSGDFRLTSPERYEQWYKKSAPDSAYLQQSTYGLSEIYAQEIKQSTFIANPGCYPTAALLALIPALKAGWVEQDSIIIDGKTGVSGAGRGLSLNTHFSETNENVKAYKLGAHQHTPEIEQILGEISGKDIPLTFSTHLLPMTRGILCTIYTQMKEPRTTQQVIEHYQSFYEGQPFVRIRPEGTWPATKEVYGSNYCDIGFVADERTGRLILVSVIDNVVKGAAGQAVQNMNLMQGWPQTTGLNGVPLYP